MTMDDTAVTPLRPAAPRRRLHPLWLLVPLAAALVAWLWFTTPKRPHAIGSYPCLGEILNPTDAGFFYQVDESTFAVRRWSDGALAWKVTIPAGAQQTPGSPGAVTLRLPAMSNTFCVSPNGRIFTAAVPDGRRVTVYTWRDGTEMGRVTLRLRQAPMLLPRNDGRVFAYTGLPQSVTTPETAYLVRNSAVEASGTLPPSSMLTPDAGLYVMPQATGFKFAKVTVKDGKITLGTPHTGTGNLNLDIYGYEGEYTYSALFAGVVFTMEGLVYRADGTVDQSSQSWSPDTTISPSSRTTLLTKDGRVRVLEPATGTHWDFRALPTRGGDVTDDGRFAMLWCERQVPQALRPLIELFPSAGDPDFVAIYERPGKLRAVMRRMDFNSWWISPDGHHIIVSDGEKMRLFKW